MIAAIPTSLWEMDRAGPPRREKPDRLCFEAHISVIRFVFVPTPVGDRLVCRSNNENGHRGDVTGYDEAKYRNQS
jgi:hypothetical protein